MKRALPHFLLLFLLGCAGAPPPVGGELPPKVYARVVSLSPSTTEWVCGLGSLNILRGRTAADTKPDLMRAVPIVANPRPDIELILKIQPDLVVVDENLINPADLSKLREQKSFDTVSFRVNSVKDWIEAIWQLGALLNQHTVTSDVVDKVEQSMRTAAQTPLSPKPKVMIAMGGSKPWVAGTESFQADVARVAGGEPIGPPGTKFVEVNPEQILKWNPDFVFVSDDVSGYTGPAWAGTNAGKKGQILQVKADMLLRPGMEVSPLIDAVARSIRNPGGTN